MLPPAAGRAWGPWVSKHFSRPDHAVHRCLLLRRALREEDVRAHCPSGRAADSFRYLQLVLPGRPGTIPARATQTVGGALDDEGAVMKRVLAVVLIAALATVLLGIDDTVSAIQSGDQKKADKQRADVAKALAGMQRGTTATVENKYGLKFDVVIEEITADSVTVLRQIDGKATSETIPIAD